jgi:hypothetical protein
MTKWLTEANLMDKAISTWDKKLTRFLSRAEFFLARAAGTWLVVTVVPTPTSPRLVSCLRTEPKAANYELLKSLVSSPKTT